MRWTAWFGVMQVVPVQLGLGRPVESLLGGGRGERRHLGLTPRRRRGAGMRPRRAVRGAAPQLEMLRALYDRTGLRNKMASRI
jgi:hypothetical protein